ncbi:MAG: hypothetical protein ABWY57_15925 [Mycetocola sp.]
MSNGPIQRERDAWLPPIVSTREADRVCFKQFVSVTAYCGRHPKALSDDWSKVTCADCQAAYRADHPERNTR